MFYYAIDREVINKMSKDELRSTLNNMQTVVHAYDDMISAQNSALCTYRSLMEDMDRINDIHGYIHNLMDMAEHQQETLHKKYGLRYDEPICCDPIKEEPATEEAQAQ